MASQNGAFERLARSEAQFRPPDTLNEALEAIRDYLDEQVSDILPERPSLIRAALAASVAGDSVPLEVLAPLAAGLEMVYYAVLRQIEAVRHKTPENLLQLLSNDLVLARALELYAAQENARLMTAVSQGAVFLCEALMVDFVDPLSPEVGRELSRFYACCAKVGAVLARASEEATEEAGARTRQSVRQFLCIGEEKGITLEKHGTNLPGESILLERVLSGWLGDGNGQTDALTASS